MKSAPFIDWSPRTDLNRQPADYKTKLSNFSNPSILIWFPAKY